MVVLTAHRARVVLADLDPCFAIERAQADASLPRIDVHVLGPLPFVARIGSANQSFVVNHASIKVALIPFKQPVERSLELAAEQWCQRATAKLTAIGAQWPQPQREPARHPLTTAEAAQLLGDDWPALQAWCEFVGAVLSQPPRWLVQTDPVQAVLLAMPQIPAHLQSSYEFFLRLSNGIGDGTAAPLWLSQLGFAADAAGTLTTVPTPSGFCALVQAACGRPAAVMPRLQRMSWFLAWERPWLLAMCQGRALINMPTPHFYRAVRTLRLPQMAPHHAGLRRSVHALLVMPGHDLTLHCLLQHRIAQADIADFGHQIAAALATVPGPLAPKPLCAFYEDDLSTHCQDLWRQCAVADDFDLLWVEQRPRIVSVLQHRLAEARQLGRLGAWLPTSAGPQA
ncbi:MAG: hypothetical protein EXR77_17155 [Myxococcales bacterium]|nr:hypothetical protein [Myxococcales bacterium]